MTIEQTGRLIAASLGPGDPMLMTRAVWQTLQSAKCWAWPKSRQEGGGYAFSIVERAGLSPPEKQLPLLFPMTRDRNLLRRHWREAAEQVLTVLREGMDVIFLVEGDASFFATFGHLQRTVLELDNTIRVEIIPGVPSPMAAAALSRRGLCDGDRSLAVVSATVGIERFERLLDTFDVVVLLKVRPLLDEILEVLRQHDLLQQTVFVERAGAPEERLVWDVWSLKHSRVHYLSLMIVHCHG